MRPILALLIFSSLAFGTSSKRTDLESLESIAAKAETLEAFLKSKRIREEYRLELVRYFGTDRFRCDSFDQILGQLEKKILQSPTLPGRLWAKTPIKKRDFVEMVSGGTGQRRYLLRTAPRRFHALFLDPSMHGCQSGCLGGELLGANRFAAALEAQQSLFVEIDGNFTGTSIHLYPVKYKEKALTVTWVSGDNALATQRKPLWDNTQGHVRVLTLPEALVATLRYEFPQTKEYLVQWPNNLPTKLSSPLESDLSLFPDPLLKALSPAPLAACAPLREQSKRSNVKLIANSLPLGFKILAPGNLATFVNSLSPLEQAAQAAQMSQGQREKAIEKIMGDVANNTRKIDPKKAQALLSLNAFSPQRLNLPKIPSFPMSDSFSSAIQDRIISDGPLSPGDVSRYINANWQNPKLPQQLAQAIQQSTRPFPLSSGVFSPIGAVGQNRPTREIASQPPNGAPAKNASGDRSTPSSPPIPSPPPSAQVPPSKAERGRFQEAVAESLRKAMDSSQCALWPVFNRLRPRTESIDTAFVPFSQMKWHWSDWLSLPNAWATEVGHDGAASTPSQSGPAEDLTKNHCSPGTRTFSELIKDDKVPNNQIFQAKWGDGTCKWVMFHGEKPNREANEIIPGSLLRGAEVPESQKHPDCLYLLTDKGPIFLACDICEKNYSTAEDRIVKAIDPRLSSPSSNQKEAEAAVSAVTPVVEIPKLEVGGAKGPLENAEKKEASTETKKCDSSQKDPDWSEEDRSLFKDLVSDESKTALASCYANAYDTSENACTYAWRLCMRTCLASKALSENLVPEREKEFLKDDWAAVNKVAQDLSLSCENVKQQLAQKKLVVPEGCFLSTSTAKALEKSQKGEAFSK